VFARAWLSHTGIGQAVPFYLETYLGGGEYMRGYSSYRFHDRNALLFGTEYRYAIHRMVDLAVLLEAGTVATTATAFSLDEMAPSYSTGVRVHSKKSGLLRMDLGGGRDGWRVAVGVSSGS
jgi:outer membrane protein assembly factor BamA